MHTKHGAILQEASGLGLRWVGWNFYVVRIEDSLYTYKNKLYMSDKCIIWPSVKKLSNLKSKYVFFSILWRWILNMYMFAYDHLEILNT